MSISLRVIRGPARVLRVLIVLKGFVTVPIPVVLDTGASRGGDRAPDTRGGDRGGLTARGSDRMGLEAREEPMDDRDEADDPEGEPELEERGGDDTLCGGLMVGRRGGLAWELDPLGGLMGLAELILIGLLGVVRAGATLLTGVLGGLAGVEARGGLIREGDIGVLRVGMIDLTGVSGVVDLIWGVRAMIFAGDTAVAGISTYSV